MGKKDINMSLFDRDSYINIDDENLRGILIQKVWRSGATGRFRLNKRARSVLLVVITVAINVVGYTSMPIYSGTMNNVNGDSYALLFNINIVMAVLEFIITTFAKLTVDRNISIKPTIKFSTILACGFLLTLNGILVVYSSPPDKTPAYLQAILATTAIPCTVVCRYFMLRKGLSPVRVICISIVLVGLFITTEPQIWGLDSTDDKNTENQSTTARILWPFCYAMAFLPFALLNVLGERELKDTEVHSFTFLMWTQISSTIWTLLFFWVDFIPGFGMAESPSDFWERLIRGTYCCYSLDVSCQNMVAKSWIFYAGYSVGLLFQFLLIEYAEGAVYAVIVQALISPLVTLFWTLFKFDQSVDYFYWSPHFNTTTVFTIVGLGLMVPGVVMYNYYSEKEAREESKRTRQNKVTPSPVEDTGMNMK